MSDRIHHPPKLSLLVGDERYSFRAHTIGCCYFGVTLFRFSVL